jgi:hypothetical protein
MKPNRLRAVTYVILPLVLAWTSARAERECFTLLTDLVRQNTYTKNRDLRDYAHMMSGQKTLQLDGPSRFLEELLALSAGEHWFDMGAGEFHAAEAYLRMKPAGAKVTAIAVPRDREVPSDLDGRLRLLTGRYVEDVPGEELGGAKLITDVYGPFTYAAHPDEVLQKYLDLLTDDGTLYLMTGAKLEYIKSTVREGGRSGLHVQLLADWLVENTSGITVERLESEYNPHKASPERHSSYFDFSAPCVTFRIRKSGGPVKVAKLDLLKVSDGVSGPVPYREYAPHEPPRPAVFTTLSHSLRPVRRGDFLGLTRAFGDPDVQKSASVFVQPDHATALVRNIDFPPEGEWKIRDLTVVQNGTDRVVGALQFGRMHIAGTRQYLIQPGEKVAQALFAFDRGPDGTFFSEIGKQAIAYGFGELGLDRIVTRAPSGNAELRASLLGLGFTPLAEEDRETFYELKKSASGSTPAYPHTKE